MFDFCILLKLQNEFTKIINLFMCNITNKWNAELQQKLPEFYIFLCRYKKKSNLKKKKKWIFYLLMFYFLKLNSLLKCSDFSYVYRERKWKNTDKSTRNVFIELSYLARIPFCQNMFHVYVDCIVQLVFKNWWWKVIGLR